MSPRLALTSHTHRSTARRRAADHAAVANLAGQGQTHTTHECELHRALVAVAGSLEVNGLLLRRGEVCAGADVSEEMSGQQLQQIPGVGVFHVRATREETGLL